MSPPSYMYLTAIPNQDAELINAECRALTGHAPSSYGIAISERCVDVKRGAYVKSCTEILFEAGSLAEICGQIKSAELHAEDFRVSVVRFPRNLHVDTMKIAHSVGGLIGGRVCLTKPRVIFLMAVTSEELVCVIEREPIRDIKNLVVCANCLSKFHLSNLSRALQLSNDKMCPVCRGSVVSPDHMDVLPLYAGLDVGFSP